MQLVTANFEGDDLVETLKTSKYMVSVWKLKPAKMETGTSEKGEPKPAKRETF